MAAVNPRQIVGKDETILFFDGRQERGTSNAYGSVAKANTGEAAVDRSKWHTRESELLRNILVVVELQAVRIDAIVSNPKFIDHCGAEQVSFT